MTKNIHSWNIQAWAHHRSPSPAHQDEGPSGCGAAPDQRGLLGERLPLRQVLLQAPADLTLHRETDGQLPQTGAGGGGGAGQVRESGQIRHVRTAVIMTGNLPSNTTEPLNEPCAAK